MSVDVSWWDEKKSIVYYKFSHDWKWDELYPELEKAIAMEISANHRVDVILDLDLGFKFPPNAISQVMSIAKKQPPNLHLSVFVSNQRYIKSLLDVVQKLSPTAKNFYRFAGSVDEAVAIIYESRQIADEGGKVPEM